MSQALREFGIDRLSVTERLALIGEIWDSIDDSGEGVSVAQWHRPELVRRRAAAEADPEAGIPWEIVKDRLTKRP